MTALVLVLVTMFHPARATVGDPVTIEFAAPTVVDPSPDYEVVSRAGNAAVIRSFVPHSITVTGRSSEGPVSVVIPVYSVLKPDDKLEPAPLKPPKPEPWPRLPFIAIGIAALTAIEAWTAVVILAKRRVTKPRIVIMPADAFRARVMALRTSDRMRWAHLADAVRAYLAAVRAEFGAELTTSELLARIEDASVARILRQGDLEKFSPWGAAPANIEDALEQALEIPSWAEPRPSAEQEAAA
ncbi:MAG TPA: hypothetical protein VN380_11705 [Thermoanaerobaculia bacterium]|jgi:hypothetical protein|nr:hypothetical protein [Thermoanaerobaculia bacterium]